MFGILLRDEKRVNSKFMILGAPADWCDVIYDDFIKNKEGLYIDGQMSVCGNWARFLYKLAYSDKSLLGKFKKNIKKSIFKIINKKIKQENMQLEYVIFCDWNRLSYDYEFLKYMRMKYENIKFVFVFTNIVEKSGVARFSDLDFIKHNYGLIISYDEENAKKYGLTYHKTVYSKLDIKSDKEPCDVFFIGNAKERLEIIINVFEILNNAGYKCCFYVNGVSEEMQKYKDIIHYNQTMSYREVVEYVQNTKCILEVCQKGANASTLRCCEALAYDKKLITNSTHLKKEKFYDEKNIYFLEGNNCEGLTEFMDSENEVKYVDILPLFSSENLLTFIENSFTIN